VAVSSCHAVHRYVPPPALADLYILDILELAGSQAKAGQALNLHQSTVCRSLRLMQQQFRLVTKPGSAVCRHGSNACLEHLRLASREHRLMEGLLRIGTDLLHQSLLDRMVGVQQVPPVIRQAEHWAELVRLGLLDGALISSFSLDRPPLQGESPLWQGLKTLPLGQLDLQLMATTEECRGVLLPRRATAGVLHQILEAQGHALESPPAACQEVEAWILRARDRGLALPLCPALLEPDWMVSQGLRALAEQPVLVEQLWLLLPAQVAVVNSTAVRRCLRRLRGLLARLAPKRHGLPSRMQVVAAWAK
jgi:hypothetical protein